MKKTRWIGRPKTTAAEKSKSRRSRGLKNP
jgi:hypothetical protein